MSYDGIIKIAGTFQLNTSLKSLGKMDILGQMDDLIKQLGSAKPNKGLDPKKMEILRKRLGLIPTTPGV